MEVIYVIQPGAYLRREGKCLKVIKGDSTLDEIPLEGLRKITLIGYVSLSGGLLDFLIQNRIETVLMTPTGRFRARLALDEHRHVELRKAQYILLSDPEFQIKTARIIVVGKLKNMANFLSLRGRHYDSLELRKSAIALRTMANYAEEANDLEKLRGIEGNASRLYFESFPLLIRNSLFKFNGRNKRPPLDPVNAMLSFVYTMLTNEVLSAINACGLDPYLGSLHTVAYGRPSLACDLVEEYRSFLGDRLVLTLINLRAVSPDDFVYRKNVPENYVDEEEMKTKRPVEMKPAICRAFIASYEKMMAREINYGADNRRTTYRMLLLYQVRSFAKYLKNPEKVYQPFVWEK